MILRTILNRLFQIVKPQLMSNELRYQIRLKWPMKRKILQAHKSRIKYGRLKMLAHVLSPLQVQLLSLKITRQKVQLKVNHNKWELAIQFRLRKRALKGQKNQIRSENLNIKLSTVRIIKLIFYNPNNRFIFW